MASADIRLIIFDCDGVLVDSEPLAIRVLVDMLARQGVEISTADAYDKFLGKTLSAVVGIVAETYGLELDRHALEAMRAELLGVFATELTAIDGAFDNIRQLKTALPVCVASSSIPERLNFSLETTGLKPLFEGRIFSATEVERGKPAPDLFLHAAEQCGVAPQNCLVIEDSPAGIAAAKAAGMRVFGFAGGAHVEAAGLDHAIAAAGPERVIASFSELLTLLSATRSHAAQTGACFVAVDAGTASVRAGVFTQTGTMLSRCEHPLAVWREGAVMGEYNSSEIWAATASAIRQAVSEAGIDPEEVKGIGFDATCSLVLLDKEEDPLPLDGASGRNTIAWFDHRAIDEAFEINATGHNALDFSGGALSPEMQLPKLLWLKRHRPELWSRIGHAFDLADFLTFKATGSADYSQSTLGAKWSFLAQQEEGWNREFLSAIGLEDLPEHLRLPEKAQPVGAPIGTLTPHIAEELGLSPTCVVAAGMVDAHAGGIGVLGDFLADPQSVHTHLGLIAGTSSCVMALSAEPQQLKGFWGPYLGTVAPGIWLNEGGQSAAGGLLDHLIRWHSAGGTPSAKLHTKIIARVGELRLTQGEGFAKDLHVLPDFHGNRSPYANPHPMGVISGLDLDESFDGLCALYWRACVGIAMGLRHILEILHEEGYGDGTLHLAGGHTHNPLLMELYADATGCTVSTQPETDALLLGAALCAATASGYAKDLDAAARAVTWRRTTIQPDPALKPAYDRDYQAYLLLHRQRAELEALR